MIEDDVKGYINFVGMGQEIGQPKEDDVFLMIFKTKNKMIVHERMLLKDVQVGVLRRQMDGLAVEQG